MENVQGKSSGKNALMRKVVNDRDIIGDCETCKGSQFALCDFESRVAINPQGFLDFVTVICLKCGKTTFYESDRFHEFLAGDINKTWKDKPDSAGWWWCVPDAECEWSERHADGLACKVVANDPADNSPTHFSVETTFANDFFGVTGQFCGDVFGRWFGPIDLPE